MHKALKHYSMKRILPRILLAALLGAALLAATGLAGIRLLAGPRPLDQVDAGQLNGKYVSFDASEVIVAFVNHTASNGAGGTKTMRTYYLLRLEDGTYLAVMDAKDRHGELLDRAMEQSKAYYLEDSGTLNALGTLSGTVKPLDGELVPYMTDVIAEYSLPGYDTGDLTALAAGYEIDLGQVGWMPAVWVAVLSLAALGLLVYAAAELVLVLAGFYQRKARSYVAAHLEGGSVSDAERDYETATVIDRTRVGRLFVWYGKGPESLAVQTSQILWGYGLPEPLVVSKYRWPVALYLRDQSCVQIGFLEKRHVQAFLDAVAAQGYPFHSGYSPELADQYQQDLEGFAAAASAAQARDST